MIYIIVSGFIIFWIFLGIIWWLKYIHPNCLNCNDTGQYISNITGKNKICTCNSGLKLWQDLGRPTKQFWNR